MAKGYTELPPEVSAAPLGSLRCAVRIDNVLRMIPLNRKPTSTPSSRSSETVNFALVDLPVAGQTTLGSVQLVMGLQAGTDWDEYFRQAAAEGSNVELDFRILGDKIFTSDNDAEFEVLAKAAAGHQKGLSEITFIAGASGDVWRIGRDIKRGSVLELVATPGATDAAKTALDLTVVSHIYYKDGVDR